MFTAMQDYCGPIPTLNIRLNPALFMAVVSDSLLCLEAKGIYSSMVVLSGVACLRNKILETTKFSSSLNKFDFKEKVYST